MSSTSCAVVVTRTDGWARLRVRGLLRNAALADELQRAGRGHVQVTVATGSVRVRLASARDEGYWLRWLDARIAAWPGGPGPALPPPSGARASARGHGKSPALPADAGPAVASARRDREAGCPFCQTSLADLLAASGAAGAPLDPQRGLAAAEAAARLARDGANEIEDVTGRSAGEILLSQFDSVPVALLGGSAGLALSTRAFADAAAIAAVLGANATLGFVTERRAEETVSSLRRLRPHQALVLRDGEVQTLDAREVVVGDVLMLRPGDPVAADARVVEAHRLATNEAALTGESLPVRKEPLDRLPADTPLGERRHMVFLGTVVSGGVGARSSSPPPSAPRWAASASWRRPPRRRVRGCSRSSTP